MAQADFNPIGVTKRRSALAFVRHMLAGCDELWQMYEIPNGQQDNVLAMLTFLHMPVRCAIKLEGGGDEDIVKEVSVVHVCCH